MKTQFQVPLTLTSYGAEMLARIDAGLDNYEEIAFDNYKIKRHGYAFELREGCRLVAEVRLQVEGSFTRLKLIQPLAGSSWAYGRISEDEMQAIWILYGVAEKTLCHLTPEQMSRPENVFYL